jgi:hypothetical protein
VLSRGRSVGINPLGPTWASSAGVGPAKLNVDMAHQFGSSPLLQASDYQARATVTNAADSYTLTPGQLAITLSQTTASTLSSSSSQLAQFRVTLDVGSYTNWNGTWLLLALSGVAVAGEHYR